MKKKNDNKNLYIVGGISILILFIAMIGGFSYILLNDNGDENYHLPTDTVSGEHIEVEDQASNVIELNTSDSDLNSDSDSDVTLNTDTDTGVESDTTTNTDIIDNTQSVTTTTDKTLPEPPLMRTPTWIRIKSSIPSSDSLWSSEMLKSSDGYENENYDPNTWISANPKYYVLEDAEVRVYQNVDEVYYENYKTSGITNDDGYTKQLDLESKGFSSYRDQNGKAYAVIESDHIVSKTGKIGYMFTVPDSKDKVVVFKVLPDTYSFSTILTSDDGLFGFNNADNLNIESMRPCMFSSSYWNLASLLDFNDFDVYLSTKSNGDWKKQTISTTDALDEKGNLHLVLRPQILTANQKYDGTPFDMTMTGHQEFYVKFYSGIASQKIFKIEFDVTPTTIDNIEWTEL